MGRLKKGVLVFRRIPPEGSEGQEIGYRHLLVDWLNRARLGTAADREAAERVGAFVNSLNDSNKYKWSGQRWLPKSRKANPDDTPRDWKSLKEHAPYYKFTIDLAPWLDGVKWELVVKCLVPSDGDQEQMLVGPGEAPELRVRWEGEEEDVACNPERLSAEAVIQIALDGRLGTIKRCEVPNCCQWFLTKDDPRARYCPQHDADDFRKDTPKRREQLIAAAKKARKQDIETEKLSIELSMLGDEAQRLRGERRALHTRFPNGIPRPVALEFQQRWDALKKKLCAFRRGGDRARGKNVVSVYQAADELLTLLEDPAPRRPENDR